MNTATSPGYIFLLAVLFVAALMGAMTSAMVLLGIGESKSSISVNVAAQALANANTCAERALQSLRSDLLYEGDETFSLPSGTCKVLPIVGYGNEMRMLCTEGTLLSATRRLEIEVNRVLPTTRVLQWKEASAISLCPS